MKRSRLAASAMTAAVLAFGCVTANSLKSSSTTELQPIVTKQGAASEAAGEQLVAKVGGADTAREQAQLDRLVDGVRASLSAPLVTGNKVTVLVDGPATFVAIDKAIAQARRHVHVETYIFSDDDLGKKFARLLMDKRRQGVEVRVIYDAIGSIKTSQAFFDELRDAGVEVLQFRPLNPTKTRFWRFHNRDHRKIIVVDGTVAFTGGLNISGAYSSSSASKPGPDAGVKEGWRDTHVQIEGPAVAQFQKLFLETWVQLGGKISGRPDSANEGYYPSLPVMGEQLASAVASSGLQQEDEAIYRTYLAAIRHAAKRIWITQAYLLPPEELSDELIKAVQRGVDVRIVVPGFSDSKLVLYASHREYEHLLEGGVRLVEAQDALLHAKTALVDDSLAIIGSANLDYRSFLHNNEVTAVVIGSESAARMQTIFQKDLDQGKEITLERWRKRPLWERTQESLSGMLKFWL